jgi:hypothetical protein
MCSASASRLRAAVDDAHRRIACRRQVNGDPFAAARWNAILTALAEHLRERACLPLRKELGRIHPVVREIELSFNRLQVLADDLTIVAYTAEPGSASAEALDLLASWTATPTTPSPTR